MKRPLSLIVGGAIGAFLIAMVGVSAHTAGLPLLSLTGAQQSHHSEEASGSRTEPKESPEASPKPEPSEKPEPTPTAKPTPQPEVDDENDDSSTSESDETGDAGGSTGQSGDCLLYTSPSPRDS